MQTIHFNYLFAMLLALCASADAQEQRTNEGQSAEQERMKRLFAESQSIAESASFYRIEDSKKIKVPIRKEPVFRHLDATRGEQGGGIWMIGEKGRPLAMTVLYTFPDVAQWVHSVRSLSTSKDIGATLAGGHQWQPTKAGLEFKPIPRAPVPASTATRRFSQMKQQARRFGGHEFWQGSRHELRLIARELHRYRDPENGIIDGAVFSIAHNTNTEAYLLIEVQEQKGKPALYYALARFGYAELHINIDGEEVWTEPLLQGTGSRDPYYLFRIARKSS